MIIAVDITSVSPLIALKRELLANKSSKRNLTAVHKLLIKHQNEELSREKKQQNTAPLPLV
jgi:hypothetical protein